MSNNDSKKNLNQFSDSLMKLYVTDLLRKNKVSEENGTLNQLSTDEKKALKDMVDDLSEKVENFLGKSSNKVTENDVNTDQQADNNSENKSDEAPLREKINKLKEEKKKDES